MKNFFLTLAISILFLPAYSQISIWLNDGMIISTKGYKIDTANKIIYYLNKKEKTKYLDFQEVFAITDKNDTLIITPAENLTTEQAFSFLNGIHDGFSYKNPKILIGNFLIGTASGFIMPQVGLSGVLSVLPNLFSSTAFGITNLKDKNIPQGDSLYRKGYNISAKKKKLILAIEGGMSGLVVGNLIGYLTKNQ